VAEATQEAMTMDLDAADKEPDLDSMRAEIAKIEQVLVDPPSACKVMLEQQLAQAKQDLEHALSQKRAARPTHRKLAALESKKARKVKSLAKCKDEAAEAASQLQELQAKIELLTAQTKAAELEVGQCDQEIAEVLAMVPKHGEDAAGASLLGAKLATSLKDIVAGAVLSATAGGSTAGSDELFASFQAKLTETATALYHTELSARQQAMAEAECARAGEAAECAAEGAQAESPESSRGLRAALAAQQSGLTAQPEGGRAPDGLWASIYDQAEARTRDHGSREDESAEATRVRPGGRSRSPPLRGQLG